MTRLLAPFALALAACGQPATPRADAAPPARLGSWMKAELVPRLRAHALPELATAFDRLAELGPPQFGRWAELAAAGATAARAGDLAGVREACATCHRMYRPRYRDLWAAGSGGQLSAEAP